MDNEQLALLGVVAAVASAAAAVIGLTLLIQNTLTGKRQSKREEIRLVASLSERWERLRDDWHVSVMRARGVDGYYVEVDNDTRNTYRARLARLNAAEKVIRSTPSTPEEFLAETRAMLDALGTYLGREIDMGEAFSLYEAKTNPGFNNEFDRISDERLAQQMEVFRPLEEERSQALADLAPYQVSTRKVLRFLAELSGQILRGLVSSESVYEAFGPEVVRQGGAIRTLLQDSERSWTAIQPGLALRVVILIDLMWAQGARLGELDTQPSPQRVAELKKKEGTGKRNRKRAYRLARQLGPRRNARRIRRLLKHAERPAETLDWEEVTGLSRVQDAGWS